MPQLFPPIVNTLVRAALLGLVVFIVGLGWVWATVLRSPYVTGEEVILDQPVQFSHAHHVGEDGIDCRYCHTSVEISPFAGMPSTGVCMNCHTQVWAQAAELEPVRLSYATGVPIPWNRVYDLPDFVYFNHAIHVNKGVGCSICHGRIDTMPLTYQAVSLQMQWCLDCHRDPEPHLRPLDQIYNMAWQPGPDQAEVGPRLRQQYNIPSRPLLESCSTCHR